MGQPKPQEDVPLPPLREDLQILPGTPTPDGVPTWTIVDTVRNQFFQIEWSAFQLLSHWQAGTAEGLVDLVTRTTSARVSTGNVMELIQFLYRNNLTRDSLAGGSQGFLGQAEQAKQHWLLRVLHNYLFFRIPVCNPDRFLRTTLPFVTPLFSRWALWCVIILGVIGCMGVVRQWESFANVFLYFFTFQGMTGYIVGLVAIKILHELGHAYTAVRYGCRVPTMGLGFLIMVPVLYTDTTDSWRLTVRKQRAAIAAAGMVVELSVAMLATFLWNFCPEGIVKSMLFVLATTSWVTGLLINLNPLLRFDGYYVLSDWLGVPNLQSRAFGFGRWKLREWLFAWGDAPPEHMPPQRQSVLIAYAWAVWVYRAVVFLGIAVLVYYLFFKVLGVILFLVEIGWFLAWPVYEELQVWWTRRAAVIKSWRGRGVGVALMGCVLVSVMPLDTTVEVPAILEAPERTTLFPPAPAMVVEVLVEEGDRVEPGQTLLILQSPQVEHQIDIIGHRIAALELRAEREVAYQDDRDDHLVIWETLVGERKALAGLVTLREQLILRAPFSGVVTDLASSLHPGLWVNTDMAVAHVIGEHPSVMLALATEKEKARLSVGNEGWFYPDDPTRPARQGQLRDLRHVDESEMALPYLASTYSGGVPVRQDARGRLIPEHSVYRVELDVTDKEPSWHQVVRGVVHVKGNGQSVMGHLWARAASILIRESGA
ncbi:site-2 protease family protein [Candidatus Nitrospira neomarina]|uniref:Biotin/lipoyl-binding protein n=1 Tax=Candidatus Nitrospira neomarina TaxID=3020899 RepID=A0AA96GTM4_9BACT|nr:site-2 protease family protein [Candidatus Nitrospira neomarina]WNM63859.1 biotin/lipoyl-binding protein [Candidatus Nitrospira neomarina]